MIKVVFMDMNGVLIDSGHFICSAAILMFRELNISVSPEDFLPIKI